MKKNSHTDFKRAREIMLKNMFSMYGQNLFFKEVQDRLREYLELLDYDPEILKYAIQYSCEENADSDSDYVRNQMPQAYSIKRNCKYVASRIDIIREKERRMSNEKINEQTSI